MKANTFMVEEYRTAVSHRREESSKIDIAVHNETKSGRTVFLDYTKNPVGYDFKMLSEEAKEYLIKTDSIADTPIERLRKLNSKAIDVFMHHGINLSKDRLKIAVCAQHNNGGVYTDSDYQTDVSGLYVIGEAAGSFGLTRPGGSALNDTQVGGLVCTKHIRKQEEKAVNEDLLREKLSGYKNLFSTFETDGSTDYSSIKRSMSSCASFIRNENECISLLEEINGLLDRLPFKNKSLSAYFYDKDMLLSAKALLETILGEMPYTGSRGGSMYIKNGEILKEDVTYRKYLTVTEKSEVHFKEVSPIPEIDEPFEKYLREEN